MRNLRWGIVAVVLALGLGACGGGNDDDAGQAKVAKAEFVKSYRAQETKLVALGAEISTALESAPQTPDPEIKTSFGALGRRMADVQNEFAKLQAPPAQQDQFDAIRRLTASIAKELQAISTSVDETNVEQAKVAAGRLAESGPKMGDAIRALAKALGLPAPAGTESTTTPTAEGGGTLTVRYAPPANGEDEVAKEILTLGGTDGVADGFTKSFKLPKDIVIDVQTGNAEPNYDPSRGTITLSYGFVQQLGALLRKTMPELSEEELGGQIAAINGFILVHEIGHAFVDLFDLPITGREEDAVDGLATVFLVDAVPNGAEYAFNAARFFKTLSDRPNAVTEASFYDEHSLDLQRAVDIVCTIAGSSQERYEDIEERGIVPQRRLQRCPSEYQQKTQAWKTLLKPHTR